LISGSWIFIIADRISKQLAITTILVQRYPAYKGPSNSKITDNQQHTESNRGVQITND